MIVRELAGRLGLEIDKSAFAAGDALLDSLKTGLVGVAAAVGAASIGFVAMARSVANHAFETQRSAKQIGMTTKEYQEYEFSARRAGIETGALNMALKQFARNAYAAGYTGGKAADGYYRLGINVRDTAGNLKPATKLLGETADALAKLPDSMKKSAIAQELFGRNGQIIIPWLNQGSKGIEELTKRAEKYGTVLDDMAIAKGVLFRQNLFNLQDALTGVKNAISVRLLPVFAGLIERLANWIAANRRLIAEGAHKVFYFFAEGLMAAYRVGKYFFDLWDKSDPKMRSTLALVGLLASALIAPWTTLQGIIGLVVEDIVGYFTGRDSLLDRILYKIERMGGIGGVFKKALSGIGGWIGSAFNFAGWIGGELIKGIRYGLGVMYDEVKGFVARLFDGIIEYFNMKLNVIQAAMNNMFRSIVRTAIPDKLHSFFGIDKEKVSIAIGPRQAEDSRELMLQGIRPHQGASSFNPYSSIRLAVGSLLNNEKAMKLGTTTTGPTIINVTQKEGENSEDFARRVKRIIDEEKEKDLDQLDAATH